MNKLQAIIDNLKSIDAGFDSIIIDATKLQKKLIIRLNTDEQLYKGIDANSKAITPTYTSYTIAIKRRKGQPTDRVTLKDEGDFYKSFDIAFSNDEFEIKATDIKRASLQRKYGSNILGLNEDSRNELAKAILPIVIKSVKERL